jgi:hypothetical protein
LEITVDIKIEELPARIIGGPTIRGYAVICDRQIRDWVRNKEEADRIAEQLQRDSVNPEDY